jgi:hypothetical protein
MDIKQSNSRYHLYGNLPWLSKYENKIYLSVVDHFDYKIKMNEITEQILLPLKEAKELAFDNE